MPTPHTNYHELRALLEGLAHTGQASPDALAYLRSHCEACGDELDIEFPLEGRRLCAACYAAWRETQKHVDPEQLARILALHRVTPEALTPLLEFIVTAPERELTRINAYYLANQCQVERRRFLSELAKTVTAGVFTMDWELYCLACNHQQHAFDSLSEAQSKNTCKNCHWTFEAPLDTEIVVTFSVHPSVRPLPPFAYDRAWHKQVNAQCGQVYAHDLLTIHAFREMFINTPLPMNERFTVERTTLLFTDLGGSTALYARQGDPRAYGLVREHFDLLTELVAQAGGAIVKTIGDAVMAVFPLGDLGLQAALLAQKRLQHFNHDRGLQGDDALQLKAGLHTGPCLAVTLNERLDYFGTTVNATARVQKLAGAGEIAFTEEFLRGLNTDFPLRAFALQGEAFMFKGLEDRPFTVYRIRPT